MIYYEVRNKKERTLASNFHECPSSAINMTQGHEKDNLWLEKREIRHVFRENDNGQVRLIIIGDEDLGNSTKGISRICDVYLGLIPKFTDIERSQRQHFDQIISRFAHNLVDLNKKLKINLERLAPDSTREKNYKDFLDSVEDKLSSNPRVAANDICQIAHSITDLEAQITSLRVISGLADEIEPSLININIQRVLFRLQQPFLSEFEKKNINIENKINSDDATRKKVCVDPQLFNVALSQIFNNAIKYMLPNTPLIINADFNTDTCIVNISMKSLCIESDEVEKIFEEKYKGRNAKDIEGSGIGMFLARRALKIMRGDVNAKSDCENIENINGKKYCQNTFRISVPFKK